MNDNFIDHISKTIGNPLEVTLSEGVLCNNNGVMIDELSNNTDKTLQKLLDNSEFLMTRLEEELIKLEKQNVFSGKDYDYFLKGYTVGCTLALNDMKKILRNENFSLKGIDKI